MGSLRGVARVITAGVMLAATSSILSAQQLPACQSENALLAFKYQALGMGRMELVQLMIVDGVIALGVNNIDGSKMCKATFRCDIQKAREMEKQYNGPHVLTQTCFLINQANEAGNPTWLRYTIKPNGEGGVLITALPN
jgi:hypothetical protein